MSVDASIRRPVLLKSAANERTNPDTGIIEERGALLDDLVGNWLPKTKT